MADISIGFNQPFSRQIDFFRKKLNVPTARWDDIRKTAHDRAFVVAGAQKADLLSDLHRTLIDHMKEGKSIDDFRRSFRDIVERHGWHGWTGEGTPKGEAWRTRVIYETNLRTSYAAGRYAQLTDPGLRAAAPYWQYIHSGHERFRPQHKAWGEAALTLRHDHPFWQTHYPPNGWGCGCTVTAVVAPDKDSATSPPEGWDVIDPKTGEPPGIDKGWSYAPGAHTDTALRQMVQDKLITYPPAIQRALIQDIKRQINTDDRIEDYVEAVIADTSRTDDLWLGFVERPERLVDAAKQDMTGYLILVPPNTARHIKKTHEHDGKTQRMAQPEDLRRLANGLETGTIRPTSQRGPDGQERFLAIWMEDGEMFRATFEVRPGRKNRSVALISLVVKRRKGEQLAANAPEGPRLIRPRRTSSYCSRS